jgi:hypothetical protein
MFRFVLAALFTCAVLTQASAQDDKPKDDAPKVEKSSEESQLTILKEIRDELKKSSSPKEVEIWAGELSMKDRVILAGQKIIELAPIILQVLIAVVLIGMRSDVNELMKGKKD